MGSRPLFSRRRRCGRSAVLTRHKRFENSTARISPRKRALLEVSLSRAADLGLRLIANALIEHGPQST